MSQVIEALKWRYAVKKFDVNKLLSKEQIDVLKEAFDLTATSYGLQPIRLISIQDKSLQKALVPASMEQQQVAQASHVLVFCIEKEIDSAYVNAYFENVKAIRNTPDAILDPFRTYLLDTFNNETPEETRTWATKQAYLAMGNLLTVCAMECIDACPMEGFDPQQYDSILGLEAKGLEAVLVMPVGIRASDDMFSEFKKVRKGVEKTILEYS